MANEKDVDDNISLIYSELLEIARSMEIEEACSELHYCCRGGDVSAVKALIEVFAGSDIQSTSTANFVNCLMVSSDNGNTPLHLAAANGHGDLVKILLDSGASLQINKNGNTPLHWAAANGHEKCVQVLLSHTSSATSIDVLQKNEFGRSALTEGFSSQNTNVVKLILEHDSASEEKLLGGSEGQQQNNNHNNSDESSSQSQQKLSLEHLQGVLHEFQFVTAESIADAEDNDDDKNSNKTLLIRELPIANADNPFGCNNDAADDTTGYGIWCASLVMARWMTSIIHRFHTKTVCELGAGCGVVGLAVANYSRASKVYVTDLNSTTLENLRYNVAANNLLVNSNSCNTNDVENNDRVVVQKMDWSDESTWPKNEIDFVLGSDLIYDKNVIHKLKHVVLRLLGAGAGTFLYVCKSTERDGMVEFLSDIQEQSCITLVSQEEITAPHHHTSNPLANGDDEECFLHFHELTTTSYMLYEFACNRTEEA